MSTFEDKVTATYDFLANRAPLRRVTNMEEVGRVVGQLLNDRQQRRINTPVRREKIRDVLTEVDRRSYAENGVLLSSLVQLFWSNDVSSRFGERARAVGARHADFREEANRAFDAYAGGYDVRRAHKVRKAETERVVNLDTTTLRSGRHSTGVERDAGDYQGRRRTIKELAAELAVLADELATAQ